LFVNGLKLKKNLKPARAFFSLFLDPLNNKNTGNQLTHDPISTRLSEASAVLS